MVHQRKPRNAGPLLLAGLTGLLAGILLVSDKAALARQAQRGIGRKPGAQQADPCSTTVATYVNQRPQQAFLRAVAVPPPTVFQAGHGLPAVADVSAVTPWDKVGLSRNIFFENGDSFREEITYYEEGEYVAYRVSHFTGAIKYFAQYGLVEWWFEDENGRTKLTWRYTFVPQNSVAKPVLELLLLLGWKRYLENALRLTGQAVDRPVAAA